MSTPITSPSLPGLTELDAVNNMLLLIGEMPVASVEAIEDGTFAYATTARKMLLECSAEVQTAGYSWNTLTKNFSPDAEGFIWCPPATLKMWAPNYPEIIIRDNKLFDREKNSYNFSKAIECVVVQWIPWDTTPFVFRKYVEIKASRRFCKRIRRSSDIVQLTQDEEMMAKAAFDSQTMQEDGTGIFSNQSAQDHLNRFLNPTRYRTGIGGSTTL